MTKGDACNGREKSSAYISLDGKYRYWLWRLWDESLPTIAFIGVNPSTADQHVDDPTIRKEIGFAKRLGFGSILALNVAAYRATDPKQCLAAEDPIGPENAPHELVRRVFEFNATQVIAAWGRNGIAFDAQCSQIVLAFPELWCIGRNQDGTPRHPLMTPYKTLLERFT